MRRMTEAFLGCLLSACAGSALAAPPPRPAHPAAPAASSTAEPVAGSTAAAPAGASSAGADVPSLAEIQTFTRAFELIKQAYVAPVGNEKLMDSAIRGML